MPLPGCDQVRSRRWHNLSGERVGTSQKILRWGPEDRWHQDHYPGSTIDSEYTYFEYAGADLMRQSPVPAAPRNPQGAWTYRLMRVYCTAIVVRHTALIQAA